MGTFLVFVVMVLLCLKMAECRYVGQVLKQQIQYQAINCRKHTASLADFGGKGDGKTSNTKAFNVAIANLSKLAPDGGAQLIVPPGKWLTSSFALTSHFTLYIHKNAVILASQTISEYPLIDPLPSYGIGRDGGNKRFQSLIHGSNLTDVVITGGNGTINGQGESWWKKFKAKELKNTRPYLIELLYSNQVQISNLILIDSPSWNVHPTYCKDVIIEHLTIHAPINSPNTDGINPDSCSNVRIRNSFVVSGDDCIAVKSGWDQYGIKVGIPTQHLSIRDFTCMSPDSAVIALGSEMSGGIQDVRADRIHAVNSQSGVRIKTAPGRGGFIRDIYTRDFRIQTMDFIFWAAGNYRSHPDNGYNPKALPGIRNINFRDFVGKNISVVGWLAGIKESPFTGFCISNVTAELGPPSKKMKLRWNCSDIGGVSSKISPKACGLLPEKAAVGCKFPTDVLPIDKVGLKTCSLVF